ncbi:MAG: HAD family phosphatase [Gemmatimonadetes bacterium]|nr:HAD family phosphatase [Gemmatimonadota bacterium]MCC6773463.1 HAD family phosphatase [Gemmatimonadaceae bacterium]
MTHRVLEAVLMEFDGVLADTAHARRDALTGVLAEDGLQLSDSDYRDGCAGLSTTDAVREATERCGATIDATGLELLALRVDRAFSDHVGKGVVLVDGAREAVERLAARVRVGIVTRASRRHVEFVLNLGQMEHLFACVIGSEDVDPPKPAPAPYLAALGRLEQRRPIRSDGLVVSLEDGLGGIRAARAAGLRCIAVGNLPAHVAMEADACIPAITGIDTAVVEQLIARVGERFA